jgi:lycopene beta-cyclase
LDKNGYFDYIFIGAGASATLLLRSLESRGLLVNKKIALIDADEKTTNDKTYCFWTSMNDTIAKDCQHLFTQTWSKISVNRQAPETLDNSRYVHISSLALYDECRRIIQEHQISRVYSSVLSIAKTDDGVQVKTDDGEFHAETIFDSRPPAFAPPKKNEAILWQTFIGHIISPMEAYSQIDCVDLMDFDIPQHGFTQFMYVLPLSNNRILVEMTRFGTEPITAMQAEPILADYIQQRFGAYERIETETGTIPMSTSKIVFENLEGVIPIGGRSGAIKPSTGYAFKKMYQAAEHIAESIETKKKLSPVMREPKRFEFYDRLLLLILLHHPMLGKPIFSVLFKKNHVFSVFRFLEGKSTIFQDIRILLTLPFRPFLRVLRIELGVSTKGLLAPFFTLGLAVLLLFIQTVAASYSFYVQFFLFTVGFLAVGLPHGAVDHLLESGVDTKGIKLSFVLKYIGMSLIFLGLWYVSANCALLFFLAYSVWHFGQCDFQEWSPNRSNTLKTIGWGTLLFGILLIGHQTETNEILAGLNTFAFPFTSSQATILAHLMLLFSFVWSIVERKASFFLTVCMLYVGMHLPLLSAFSLYFIGQHSLNGWRHLKTGLNTNNQTLYLKSLPFNLGAIGLLLISYWLSENYFHFDHPSEMTSIFFVFLSCISFPHIIWMHNFYKKIFC